MIKTKIVKFANKTSKLYFLYRLRGIDCKKDSIELDIYFILAKISFSFGISAYIFIILYDMTQMYAIDIKKEQIDSKSQTRVQPTNKKLSKDIPLITIVIKTANVSNLKKNNEELTNSLKFSLPMSFFPVQLSEPNF